MLSPAERLRRLRARRRGEADAAEYFKVAEILSTEAPLQRELARRGNIEQAWTNLSKTGALAPPGKLPVVKPPPPPSFESHAQPAQKLAPRLPEAPQFKAPTFTMPTMKPAVPPVPPVKPVASPPQQVASQVLGATSQQSFANAQKLGEWLLRPKPGLRPGQIHPDNGEAAGGKNPPLYGGKPSREVSQAFDRLRTPTNSDPFDPLTLNSNNEGIAPAVGA